MAYKVRVLPLDAVIERQEVHPDNIPLTSFHVLSLTAGTEPTLAIGDGAPIPAFAGYVADLCPPEVRGLWLSNPIATPGAVLVVQTWSESGSSRGAL